VGPGARATSLAKNSGNCWTTPSPRAKRALLQHRRPPPGWNGVLAFQESFGLPLAAILVPTLFLFRAAAGINRESGSCNLRASGCRDPMSSGEPNVPFRRDRAIAAQWRKLALCVEANDAT
jgi:hypothetical protein